MNIQEIEKIVNGFGASLYDAQVLKEGDESFIFRVSIQKEGGVTLDLCADINAVLSPYLDTNPPVKGQYYLEVGSPGIERNLKTTAHFEKSIGETVKVSLKDKTKLKGKLLGIEGEKITVESEGGERREFSFGDISKARTYFEWK